MQFEMDYRGGLIRDDLVGSFNSVNLSNCVVPRSMKQREVLVLYNRRKGMVVGTIQQYLIEKQTY